MNVPAWAGFVADFPDDQIEGGGDIQVYGGRNVALALGEVFASLGCDRISELLSAGEVGWEFDFHYGDLNRFGCRVQSFHPVFWLLFEQDSLSDGEAYVQLWRKFAKALELDPRFHKILWRSSKDGPPDWDEVEEAVDPPAVSFDERFPASEIKAKSSRPSIWPYVIGIWLTASGVTTAMLNWTESDLFHKIGHLVAGIFLGLIGALFLLIAIGQNRETLFGLPRARSRQNARYEEPSLRPRPPRPRAAGGSSARAVILVGLALTVVVLILVANFVPRSEAQATMNFLAILALLVGLAIALPVIDRLRKRRSQNADRGPDTDA